MPAYKFTFSRRAIINEVYEIEADTVEEAEETMSEGLYGDPVFTEFCDWYDSGWDLDNTECLDTLVKMIKDYEDKTVDILD
jgi:hypothetical protein